AAVPIWRTTSEKREAGRRACRARRRFRGRPASLFLFSRGHDGPGVADAGHRVDRLAVLVAHLKMQVRAGGEPGRADAADQRLAARDGLADVHVDFRQVAVARGLAVRVADLDELAVAFVPAGLDHAARAG